MHNAPAVSYPVGRSRFQGQLIGFFVVLGWVTGLLWWSMLDLIGWRQGVFFAVLVAACFASVRAWLLCPVGVLTWEGPLWRFSGAFGTISGTVSLHLDFQFFMLLCVRSNDGERLWLWLEQRTAPVGWLALRRAVISSAADRVSQARTETLPMFKP